MAFAILRTEKLKGASVSASDKHTERERKTPNADEKKLKNNIRLIGEPGEKLRDLVNKEIEAAGGKPRKDSVECVEFLMTASREYFDKPMKTVEFAKKATDYMEMLEKRGLKFVKALMHVDEMTPHVVAYAVPFDPTGKLNAKYHFGGNKWRMAEYQDEFAEFMQPLGLERGIRGSTAEHQKIQRHYGKIELYDQAVTDMEIAKQNEEQMRLRLEENNRLFSEQLKNRIDISLRDVAAAFTKPERLLETSRGLAVLRIDNPGKIQVIITSDNKAFLPAGDKVSDGSSVMLLQTISGKPTETVLSEIGNKFDDDAKQRAARAYGEELAMTRRGEIRKLDFSQAEKEVETVARQNGQGEESEIKRVSVMR
jgi:hypothetical protein